MHLWLCKSGEHLYLADVKNERVIRWLLGSQTCQIVAGRGAPVNGVNVFGGDKKKLFSVAVDYEGQLMVPDS